MSQELFQFSTITALVVGNYDGVLSYKEAKTKGNFGIGTFDALDGELIALDGQFFQMMSDGTINPVTDEMTTPFVSLCHFKGQHEFIAEKLSSKLAQEKIQELHLENEIVAIQIEGQFSQVNTRTVARQEKPYKKMFEISNLQSENTLTDINGTIVGYFTPEYLNTVGVNGVHFHFINSDKTVGGHVLDFAAKNIKVTYDVLKTINLTISATNGVHSNLQTEIKKLEGLNE